MNNGNNNREADRGNYTVSDHPRVSVITIFFNAESFLAEAIESVITQTFDNWELLLVDDGSVDSSAAIARDYAVRHSDKIRCLNHPGHANLGMSATRNLGIAHARGKYIAFIDADDVWLPTKLADQVTILDENEEVAMVCGTAIYWSSWSGGDDRIGRTGHKQDCIVKPTEAALKLYPLGSGSAPCPSDLILRASVVRDVGGFEERFKGLYEDQAFLSKLYLTASIYIASDIWLKYRRHDKSCVSLAAAAGTYHDARHYFLRWFEEYVATKSGLDDRVKAAVHRALRRYRQPHIDLFMRLPSQALLFFRRTLAFLNRKIGQHPVPKTPS